MKTKIELTKKQIQPNNYNIKLTRGRKMKYFSIILTVMVTALIGRSTEPQTGWWFDQSNLQAFYYFNEVTIDNVEIPFGKPACNHDEDVNQFLSNSLVECEYPGQEGTLWEHYCDCDYNVLDECNKCSKLEQCAGVFETSKKYSDNIKAFA